MKLLVLASSLLLVVAVLTGCSPVKRHAVLSFFLDGVPPYVTPEELARLEEEELKRVSEAILSAGFSGAGTSEPSKFFHGPFAAEECWRCHKLNMSPGGSRRGKQKGKSGMGFRTSMAKKDLLRKPVNQVCLPCHDDFSKESPGNEGMWLHGPVSSGWCVMCHDPHESPYQSLVVVKAIGNICASCHRAEDLLADTSEHRYEGPPDEDGAEDVVSVDLDCTRCHDPHRGRDHRLLRADYEPRSLRPDGQEQTDELDNL